MKNLISEQKLTSIINSTKFITNLILIIELMLKASSRSALHGIDSLKKLEPLIRQSLANGRKDLKKGEIKKVVEDTRKILDIAAKNLGFDNWEELISESNN